MGDSPFILKDGVQPTLCRWVFEINFQKTPTSILKSCLLWRLQCLWGTANHDTEPPWSIGAPRHVSLGGQPPASNQFSFCRTQKTHTAFEKVHEKSQKNACAKIYRSKCFRRHLGGRIQSLMNSLRSLRRCKGFWRDVVKTLQFHKGFGIISRTSRSWWVFSFKLHDVISLRDSCTHDREVTSCGDYFWCRSRCGHQTRDSPCEWMDTCSIVVLVAHSNTSGFCQNDKMISRFSWSFLG